MIWKKALSLLRGFRKACLFLIFVLLTLLAYLHFYGLPSSWRQTVLQELARRGVLLQIESLHLDPWLRVVMRGVEWSSASAPGQSVRVSEIAVDVSLLNLLRRQVPVDAVEMPGADVRICLGRDVSPVDIRHAHAAIHLGEDGVLQVRSLVGELFGMRLEMNGRLDLTRASPSSASPSPPPDSKRVQSVIDKLAAIRADKPVTFRVNLEGRASEPDTLRAVVEISGKDVAWQGWRVDAIKGTVVAFNGVIEVPVLRVDAGKGRAILSGEWNLAKARAQFEFFSDLQPTAIFEGTADAPKPRALAELEFGAAPMFWAKGEADLSATNLWDGVNADVSFAVREMTWRDQTVRELHGSGRLQGGTLKIPDFRIVQDFGRLDGSVGYDLDSQAITFDIASTLDLAAAMKLLYPGEKNWFRLVKYRKPPLLRLAGRWLVRDRNGLQATGVMDWRDWSASGVAIRSTKAKVKIEGRTFRFNGLNLAREEGEIAGDFTLDFSANLATLDVNSSIAFLEFTRIIGPKTEEMFRPYQFLTPPRIKLQGIISFGDEAKNDLLAHVECDRFKVWKLTASKVVGDVLSYRNSLEIARYSSEFYGGRLEGDAVFDFTTPEQDWTFQCRADRADFDRFTHDIWEYNEVQGNMTGWASMSGTMKNSQACKGEGEVKVAEGVLWRIPLFGELSRFIPILGVQKATKASAPFTVADEQVRVNDMKISAGIMSLTAKGTYKFDQSLDFIVQGHFLRGLFGIGYVFDPFTKVFEYHLGGKLQDRKWKPRFLPKELLLQFGDDATPKAGSDSNEKRP